MGNPERGYAAGRRDGYHTADTAGEIRASSPGIHGADPTREIVSSSRWARRCVCPWRFRLSHRAGKAGPFRIANGLSLPVYHARHDRAVVRFGDRNRRRKRQKGSNIAISLPEGNAYRAAELFTNDSCFDLTRRVSDNWAQMTMSERRLRSLCRSFNAGAPRAMWVRALARIQLPDKPNHKIRTPSLSFK